MEFPVNVCTESLIFVFILHQNEYLKFPTLQSVGKSEADFYQLQDCQLNFTQMQHCKNLRRVHSSFRQKALVLGSLLLLLASFPHHKQRTCIFRISIFESIKYSLYYRKTTILTMVSLCLNQALGKLYSLKLGVGLKTQLHPPETASLPGILYVCILYQRIQTLRSLRKIIFAVNENYFHTQRT